MTSLHGAVAAAVTPLRDDGARLDEEAFVAYADFLHAGGVDGLLALGTTGEGILLSVEERSRAVELFVGASTGRFFVIAHCGAQTTADTVELVRRAAHAGADAVAVIGPPYFKLDAGAQLAHLEAAAAAAAPLPFYVYEFAATAGYPFSVEMLARLRDRADNFRGLKVSDSPWEAFEPYLLDGLDVFVGPEVLIHRGLEHGAVGCVSGLAAAFPEEVAAVVRAPSAAGAEHVGGLRAVIERFPRHAALKWVLGRRGVPVRADVRAPLRQLTSEEAAELDTWLEGRGG
jgi:dihydrodipicolinate synthase/N-acetylneuraminate lyase